MAVRRSGVWAAGVVVGGARRVGGAVGLVLRRDRALVGGAEPFSMRVRLLLYGLERWCAGGLNLARGGGGGLLPKFLGGF